MNAATSLGPTSATTWNLDPIHSSAQFKVKHMMISNVKGEFHSIKGSVTLDSADITKSSVEATIDVSTINTREEQRDGHLKSADFFDVAKFPTMTFKSTEIRKTGVDTLAVSGDLTIHGVARNVVLDVEGPTAPIKDPYGNTRIGLSATTHVNRKDFGLTWNGALEAGGIIVGEEVAITLDLEFVKS
jgi:polyisoprenoid-binding protein YceI